MDPADGTVRSGSRLNQVILLRLDPETLSAETRARAADGVVAYTSICTHTGCDVDDWQPAERLARVPVPLLGVRSERRRQGSSTAPRRGRCRRCR